MMAVDLQSSDQSLLSSSSGLFVQEHDSFFSWSRFGSSDSGSVLSSPVESELGSAETEDESDLEEEEEEDYYCAELSRQMALYMLREDDKHEKSWGSTGSPQSTLRSPFGSSHESPKGPSREPSPPPVPAMIEELEKMKIINKHLCNQTAEFQTKQALIHDQIRAIQVKHTMKKLDHKSRAFGGSNNGQKTNRPRSSTSWSSMHQTQTHQQQPSSGMKAVFLGGSASSRAGSCGTGVFLPRGGIGYSPPDHSRNKPGCATVLIPARVVQALKQHFDKVGGGVPSGFHGSTFPIQQDAEQQSMNKQDQIGLPQEWTY